MTTASARGVSLLTTAISVPLTLGYLGAERFGVWMTLSAFIAIIGFSDLGLGNSLLNSVAHAAGRDDRDGIRAYVTNGMLMLLAIAALLGLAFAVGFEYVPWAEIVNVRSEVASDEVGPAAAALILCFLIGLPASALGQVRLGLQQGYVNAVFVGGGNILGLIAVIVATRMELGLPWLVLGMAGGPVVAMMLNGLMLLTSLPWLRPRWDDVNLGRSRSLLRVGLLFLMLQMAVAVAFTSDSIILASLVGPAAVAEYAVVVRIFMIPSLLVSFALAPLWPAYREALSRGDSRWVRRTFGRSVRFAAVVACLVSAMLIVVGMPLVQLWVGDSVRPRFELIVAVGIWTALTAVGTSVAMLLNGAQVMRFQLLTAGAMAIANVSLSVVLVGLVGTPGVVWGSIVAYISCTLIPVAMYLPRLLARLDRVALRQEP
jgi:O-antigen/teichoic acid export membrane protein